MSEKNREATLEKYVERYMFRDIQVCIDGNANFPAALCLSAYTDALGGLINGTLTERDKTRLNYTTFLQRMGYTTEESERYYVDIRCGLAHQYFIKGEATVGSWSPNTKKGIYEFDGVTYFFTKNYFYEFKTAYSTYKDQLKTDSALQSNFDNAISDETVPYEVRSLHDPSIVSAPMYGTGSAHAVNTSGSVVIFVMTATSLDPKTVHNIMSKKSDS